MVFSNLVSTPDVPVNDGIALKETCPVFSS
jgi:hypothetical protein